MLIYTSGSTGLPKGVMLTHRNVTSAWASVQSFLKFGPSDVVGLVLPPVFSYGLINLLMALGEGATLVIERAVAFPVKVAQTLERERVTVFPGVPTLFHSLLALADLGRFDLAAIRLVTNAAAHLSNIHLDRLLALLPGAEVMPMYGMTECIRVTFLPPDEIDRRPGSVGRGMPNQEHWLVDEEGRRLPRGATGQLVVRGNHVMRGYWQRPADTAERLKPGEDRGGPVLHTGDLFRTDADGFLYFVSRMDDIIKTRGEKVAPKEVENAIHEIDGVVDCAVVGVADELLGEAIKAYVTVQHGATLGVSDIIKHCLARLESHMAPKYVEFVSTLPRTESGKIRHASLRR
jgi:acyl-CoA synthetase (AMP-forming)/AMP-acid ligase II